LPISRAGISLVVVLLPLVYIIEGNFKEKIKQIKQNKVLIALLLYIMCSFLYIFVSEDIEMGLKMIRLNTYMLTVIVIATTIKEDKIFHIIGIFLIGMFISEIIAYGVFFEFWKFKDTTSFNPSPFMMHMDYSIFMAFTSLLLLNKLFFNKYSYKEKLIYLFFFLTVTGNLFLATGRTGQVAYIGGIIVLSILHFKISWKSFFLSLLLLSSIFTTAYKLSNSFQIRVQNSIDDIEKIQKFDFSGSWGIRSAYWITTYNILQEHPFGVGIGDFELIVEKELKKDKYLFLNEETKKFMGKVHPHNQYLLILLQMGVVGIIIFFYFIYQILKLEIKNKELKYLSILFIVIYSMGFMGEPLFLKQFTLSLFVLFIGLITIKTKVIH
jgi:O-antigen ligase